jgi:transposase
MTAPILHYLGCDRSDAYLDFTLRGDDTPTESFRLPSRAAALEAWFAQWRHRFPQHQLCVCFEQPASNLIVLFSRFDFVRLYPINPATLKNYRQAFVFSRAKDDATDAAWLADLVRVHRDKLTVWMPHSPVVRQLTALVEQRRSLVNACTAWSNKLTSLLKDYYPEALDMTGEHTASTLAIEFLHRWPTLQKFQAAHWATVEKFCRHHHSGRPGPLARRQEVHCHARPLTDDPAILGPAELYLGVILDQLEPLIAAIDRYDTEIAQVFAAHPDHDLIRSFPGIGPILAPRLLSALGDDRTRFADASDLQCFSGIAPVYKHSGLSTAHVVRRRACPHFIRQTFHEHALESVQLSRWARAYYEQLKQRGLKRHTIARALAYKWQRIMIRCWQSHTPYDEVTYLRSLEKRNPVLHAAALKIILPKEKKAA